MEIIQGDLIEMALDRKFDIITHGCNCQCKQKSGIAKAMVSNFRTDDFLMELDMFKGDINKLGSIDVGEFVLFDDVSNAYPKKNLPDLFNDLPEFKGRGYKELLVINSYTQFYYGKNHSDGQEKPLDYEALTLCLRKINNKFKGKTIGLPYLIGCGLAGGDELRVLKIIEQELKDLNVIIVDKDGKSK